MGVFECHMKHGKEMEGQKDILGRERERDRERERERERGSLGVSHLSTHSQSVKYTQLPQKSSADSDLATEPRAHLPFCFRLYYQVPDSAQPFHSYRRHCKLQFFSVGLVHFSNHFQNSTFSKQ